MIVISSCEPEVYLNIFSVTYRLSNHHTALCLIFYSFGNGFPFRYASKSFLYMFVQ